MTNAVDILMIDGPRAGRSVCMNRPVTKYIEVLATEGTVQYTTVVYDSTLLGKKYHIATVEPEAIDPSYTDGMIVTCNHTPGWDINPKTV